eukprot:TRINITY_DN27598_c0_g1_i2.p1 TRINITY_DN27598_c0_g1~~TRINITY_DN27598_c0_g1_i2.p1  ORF type:complete len:542 (+),score=52.20 TRINITY_DN27598_c0_g1_i2:104-1729(+)
MDQTLGRIEDQLRLLHSSFRLEVELIKKQIETIAHGQVRPDHHHHEATNGDSRVDPCHVGGMSTEAFVEQDTHLKRNKSSLEIRRSSTLRRDVYSGQVLNTPVGNKHVDHRKRKLRRIFQLAKEADYAEECCSSDITRTKCSLTAHGIDWWIDYFMDGVILLNAFMIGVSLDVDSTGTFWVVSQVVFSLLFLLEIGFKIVRNGFCGFYWHTEQWISHWFDSLLVVVDAMQVFSSLLVPGVGNRMDQGGVPSASLFRILRFLRFSRVLRVLRSDAFSDLQAMLQGFVGAITTLFWAILFFLLVIYVAALFCREAFGEFEVPNVKEHFHSVPRAMLTIFRCSFGECDSAGGVPIFEHVILHYGEMYSAAYCAFTFFVTVGLFNVISAVFVDSVYRAQSRVETEKMNVRLQDEQKFAGTVCLLLRRLLSLTGNEVTGSLASQEHLLFSKEFNKEDIDALVIDTMARTALSDLDIDPNDHHRLSDILDPDQSGTIDVFELLDGLRRLRGQPRRSDIIAVDLMMRCLQCTVDEILDRVRQTHTMHV